jgi:hypothetical protein
VSGGMLRRSPQALWRRAGTEVVTTLPETEDIQELGGAAAAVWLGLDEATSAADLIGLLAEVYAIEPDAIAGDVEVAVAELVHVGLVVVT